MSDLAGLLEDFELFDNWEDRYRYVIDMGQSLPEMDAALKVESNIVRGCTSQVWMFLQIQENEQGQKTLDFVADSDAMIVRGLINILVIAFQGQTFAHINEVDMDEWFEKMGLSQHLSPSRRNGFFSMVEKIQNFTKSN